ncbi:MAG TPA: MFS transporter [Candidatus Limnocylindrales bacterium]
MGVEVAPRGRRRRLLLALAVLATAANLRPALAVVGPLLAPIRADLGLSAATASVLTTVPVLCFGLLSPLARPIARRLGPEHTVVTALVGLGLGTLLRLGPSPATLLAGTVLVGGSIAVANVLLPVIVKLEFPERAGLVTGLYTTVLSLASAVAAGTAVPLAALLAVGWRGGFAAWLVPIGLAIAAWLPRLRSGVSEPVVAAGPPARATQLARSPLAWQVAVLFGIQSLGFYAVLAWLPSVYTGLGLPPVAAGGLLGLAILVGTGASFVAPSLAARVPDQRPHLVVATLATAAGLAGIAVAPLAAPPLWAVLVGAGQGATFPLVLTVIVLRSRTAEETARLSVFAQSVGYVIAAFGPLAVGLVHDATGSWSAAIGIVAALMVPQLLAALGAGRPRPFAEAAPR